jgi:hypothetical protein
MTATRNALGSVSLAAATVTTWWAWLGRDTEYRVDPVTLTESGPYEVWQVAGCVLTLAAIAVAGGLVLAPWLVAGVMTVSFTAAWAGRAATSDESGLWLVGAIGVFIGMAIGSTVLSTSAWAVRRAVAGRRRPQGGHRPQGTIAGR